MVFASFISLILNGPENFSLESIFKLVFALVIFLSIVMITLVFINKEYGKELKQDSIKEFNIFVFTIGLLIALKAWFYGMDGVILRDEMIRFSGSHTSVGVLSTIVCFIIIYINQNIGGVLFSFPYLYLSFFSTSRLGYLIFILLLFFFVLRTIMHGFSHVLDLRGCWFKKTLLLLLLSCSISSMFLFTVNNRFFPYFISEKKIQGNGEVIKDIFLKRLSRVYSAFNEMSTLVSGNLKFTEEKYFVGYAKPQRRHSMYYRTVRSLGKEPMGHWPILFRNKVFVGHDYPHNLFLEMGYYFGYLAMIVFVVFVITLAFLLLCRLLSPSQSIGLVFAIIFLGTFISMNFTGTFYDYFPHTAISLMVLFVYPSSRSLCEE